MTFEEFKTTEDAKKLLEKLKRRLAVRGFTVEEDEHLYDEIESAIESVNERRHFVPTKERLFEEKYSNIVIRLCICSIAKMGAEGQSSHSENGVSRGYEGSSEHPDSILREIVPLARVREI